MLRKVIGWGIVLFLVFWVLTQPAGAAHTAHSALNGLHHAAASLASFVDHL